jgi:hypothetical protein
VNRFVKECRREWRRLRVADSVANEMAADLSADLAEAEAEGASIEDVLGSSAFDPRAFARSWASERGVSRAAPAPRRSSRRWLPLAALAATAVTLIGAVLLTAPRPRVAISSVSRALGSAVAVVRHPGPIGPPPGIAVRASTAANHVHAIGLLVLIIGLAGIVATLSWAWRTRSGGGPGWGSPSAA